MVQLGTKRTALALYGVLLVLPTIVLGGVHWHQLLLDHETMTAAVPGQAASAVGRMQEALARRLEELLEREDERPFYLYRKQYYSPDTLGSELAFVHSPLQTGPVPAQILGWFAYDGDSKLEERPTELFLGGRNVQADREHRRDDLGQAADALRLHDEKDVFLVRLLRQRKIRSEFFALPAIAINVSTEQDLDCLRQESGALEEMRGKTQRVATSDFHVRFYREADGTPRVLASRTVYVPPDRELASMPRCFDRLEYGALLRQGFFIDPHWLFEKLPEQLARQILDDTIQYVPTGAEPPAESKAFDIFPLMPVKALGFETYNKEDEEYGTFHIAVNTIDLGARFSGQKLRFLGLASMLVISLGTGLLLLLRSVNRDLESALRTENFVAAVTHELRTPVSAIKLYGEMLEDGWVEDEGKKREYYKRIVRETARLETLVERVLEKSQIARREIRAEPGDLNAVVENLITSLSSLAQDGVKDLSFELQPGLPDVMLIPEGVRSIVINLVENARKYAPVPRQAAPDMPEAEPIRIRTHVLAGQVVLDVLDRGPGIPRAERSRIFEAFYRMGNENTRTARGTGLGLHLVALQSQAMDARVAVLDRKGGGTVFRVTFTKAPPERRAAEAGTTEPA